MTEKNEIDSEKKENLNFLCQLWGLSSIREKWENKIDSETRARRFLDILEVFVGKITQSGAKII